MLIVGFPNWSCVSDRSGARNFLIWKPIFFFFQSNRTIVTSVSWRSEEVIESLNFKLSVMFALRTLKLSRAVYLYKIFFDYVKHVDFAIAHKYLLF